MNTNSNIVLALIALAGLCVTGIIALAALGAAQPEALGDIATYVVAGIFGAGAGGAAVVGTQHLINERKNKAWAEGPPPAANDGMD